MTPAAPSLHAELEFLSESLRCGGPEELAGVERLVRTHLLRNVEARQTLTERISSWPDKHRAAEVLRALGRLVACPSEERWWRGLLEDAGALEVYEWARRAFPKHWRLVARFLLPLAAAANLGDVARGLLPHCPPRVVEEAFAKAVEARAADAYRALRKPRFVAAVLRGGPLGCERHH